MSTTGRRSAAGATEASAGDQSAVPSRRTPPSSRGGFTRVFDFANWSVRTKLLSILVLPVVAACFIGAFQVRDLLATAADYAADAEVSAAQQATGELVRQLGREQVVSVADVAGVSAELPELASAASQQSDTDAAAATAQALVEGLDEPSAEVLRSSLALESALGRLVDIRANATSVSGEAGLTPAQTVRAYDDVSATALRLGQALTDSVRDDNLQSLALSSGSLVATFGVAYREDALVLAVTATGADAVDPAELRAAITDRAVAFGDFQANGSPAEQASYGAAFNTDTGRQRSALLSEVLRTITSGGTPNVTPQDWITAATATSTAIDDVQRSISTEQVANAAQLRDDTRAQALRQSVIVVVLLLLGFGITLLAVRSVLRPLRVLRADAMAIAQQTLPEEIARLREGRADPGQGVAPVGVSTVEEIGQVARAFDAVHQEALRLAGEQEQLRRNIGDIFVNLSRRSQGLVERQLALIDRLENVEQDPDQLSQLFRLDHLASRMRRNNDNLLVLAGSDGARGGSRPTAVVDVVRAAVSETEQYERVVVNPTPAVTVAGPAANDLVHLLAELLDNATVFSPPDSAVTVAVSGTFQEGLVIEVYDRGLGIAAVELDTLNRKLAEAPVVDAQVPRQMGLFVVSRLARRHDMQVELRASASGAGTVAAVWVPPAVLVADPADVDSAKALAPAGTVPPSVTVTGSQAPLMLPSLTQIPSPSEAQPLSPRREPAMPMPLVARPSAPQPAMPEPAMPQPAMPRPAMPQPAVVQPALPQPVPLVPAAAAAEQPSGAPVGTLEMTPIFFEVSAWFQSDTMPIPTYRAEEPAAPAAVAVIHELPVNGRATVTAAASRRPSFDTAADAGWRAVQATMTGGDTSVTAAGLPKRRPKANLVPGSAPESAPAAARSRDAEAVRGRLSSYQRGLQSGRTRTAERTHDDPRTSDQALDDRDGQEPAAERHDDERRYAR